MIFQQINSYKARGKWILSLLLISGSLSFSSRAQPPSFLGGKKAFYEFLDKNLKYPVEARNQHVIGRMYVRFAIEKDGSVTHVKALSSPGHGVAEEAERIVKLSPKWMPGVKDGKKIRVIDTLPIHFILDNKHIYFDASPSIIVDTDNFEELVTAGTNTNDFIYEFGSPAPQFPGGIEKFYNILYRAIKYPDKDLNKNVQGRVLVKFIVEKDGSLSHIEARGPDKLMEQEAIRVVSLSPKWIPGKFEDKISRVNYGILLFFTSDGIDVSSSFFNLNDFKNALILVNGKEMPRIRRTKDMKKIEILNGTAATSLYGERGKNGVILMTTYK